MLPKRLAHGGNVAMLHFIADHEGLFHFQSFQRPMACDLKVRKFAEVHFTRELSPIRLNIALAHERELSSTPFIHLRQL